MERSKVTAVVSERFCGAGKRSRSEFVVKGVKMASRLEINDYLDNIQPKEFDA
ncbi:hypothetical protein YC2023_120360 [Brassica napus]